MNEDANSQASSPLEQTSIPNLIIVELKDGEPKSDIEQRVKDSYLVNKDFFGKDPPPFKVTFVHTRAEYDQITGRKSGSESVGSVDLELYVVVLFHPSVYTTESVHPISTYSSVMTHELTHAFQQAFFKNGWSPAWLNEGMAGYIALQYKHSQIRQAKIEDFTVLHNSMNFFQNPEVSYAQSNLFTKYLIENYGKTPLFTLLENLTPNEDYSEFSIKFKQYYGMELDLIKQSWIQAGLKDHTITP